MGLLVICELTREEATDPILKPEFGDFRTPSGERRLTAGRYRLRCRLRKFRGKIQKSEMGSCRAAEHRRRWTVQDDIGVDVWV